MRKGAVLVWAVLTLALSLVLTQIFVYKSRRIKANIETLSIHSNIGKIQSLNAIGVAKEQMEKNGIPALKDVDEDGMKIWEEFVRYVENFSGMIIDVDPISYTEVEIASETNLEDAGVFVDGYERKVYLFKVSENEYFLVGVSKKEGSNISHFSWAKGEIVEGGSETGSEEGSVNMDDDDLNNTADSIEATGNVYINKSDDDEDVIGLYSKWFGIGEDEMHGITTDGKVNVNVNSEGGGLTILESNSLLTFNSDKKAVGVEATSGVNIDVSNPDFDGFITINDFQNGINMNSHSEVFGVITSDFQYESESDSAILTINDVGPSWSMTFNSHSVFVGLRSNEASFSGGSVSINKLALWGNFTINSHALFAGIISDGDVSFSSSSVEINDFSNGALLNSQVCVTGIFSKGNTDISGGDFRVNAFGDDMRVNSNGKLVGINSQSVYVHDIQSFVVNDINGDQDTNSQSDIVGVISKGRIDMKRIDSIQINHANGDLKTNSRGTTIALVSHGNITVSDSGNVVLNSFGSFDNINSQGRILGVVSKSSASFGNLNELIVNSSQGGGSFNINSHGDILGLSSEGDITLSGVSTVKLNFINQQVRFNSHGRLIGIVSSGRISVGDVSNIKVNYVESIRSNSQGISVGMCGNGVILRSTSGSINENINSSKGLENFGIVSKNGLTVENSNLDIYGKVCIRGDLVLKGNGNLHFHEDVYVEGNLDASNFNGSVVFEGSVKVGGSVIEGGSMTFNGSKQENASVNCDDDISTACVVETYGDEEELENCENLDEAFPGVEGGGEAGGSEIQSIEWQIVG
jgi:5S rRNA maturation endonuclease (ribonuclease M5)